MEAQVHITGYAGTEVETRGNGTVSAFRLACTPRIKTKGGWGDGNTTWIEVACFRTLAQHVAQSVRKGKTKGGWGDGNTTWIEVACFRTLAQHVAQSVRKGDPVVVVGKLRTNV